MSLNVPAYRVTEDDLADADKKTKRELGPLLEALNRSLTAAAQALVSLSLPDSKASSFTTDAAGSVYVDLKLGSTPTDLWISGSPVDSRGAPPQNVWSMSWTPLSSGARLLFLGLSPSTTYSFRIRYQ